MIAVAVVVLLAAFVASADSTAQSLVDCGPRQVEPFQSVTCTIFVRDSLQEPTTMFSVSDFYISPVASVSGTSVTVSPATIGSDPTTVVFTLASASGANIQVNVYLRATGEVLRGSGLVVVVLVWPATRLGTFVCSQDAFVGGALPLRGTTTCSALASGNNGLPAAVHPADVYFSEDHYAGSFLFLSGATQLVFNYSAPSTISATFSAFVLRVTLSSAAALYSVTIPMTYPLLAPSALSVLQCSGLTETLCFIAAQDSLGPVLFQASSFVVSFEKLDTVNNVWTPSTNALNVSIGAGPTANVARVGWSLLTNNEISTQRIHVFLAAATGPTTGPEIVGSPFFFTCGVAPTPAYVSFRGCAIQYILSANYTTCTIDLLNGVTGDPRYFNIASSTGGSVSSVVYGMDTVLRTPVLTFVYTAPSVTLRSVDSLSVSVLGANVLNSPRSMIVYPATIVTNPTSATNNNPAIIALGMVFYGTFLGVGLRMFFARQEKIRRVQLARAERERMEKQKTHDGELHHTYATAHTGKDVRTTRSSSINSSTAPGPKPASLGTSVPQQTPPSMAASAPAGAGGSSTLAKSPPVNLDMVLSAKHLSDSESD